jgi:glutamate-ammonia-ligase adenylyltransferase
MATQTLKTIKVADLDEDHAALGTPLGPFGQDGFLKAVAAHSSYLGGLLKAHNETVERSRDGFAAAVAHEMETLASSVPASDDELKTTLRVAKQRVALLVGLADLGGWWSSDRVGQTISDFADLAVARGVEHLIAALVERRKLEPGEGLSDCGYTVLAMGKHGAGELNYSSDIDLIVLIDPDAERVPDRDEAVATFVRMTRQLLAMLQDRTADGYVFRTDLRLRPDPGSMPIAVPVSTALSYYEARGQNWERAALIKARPVAGDLALGAELLKELRPFIWRRYLDYAAIADIHSIKRQLQAHRGLGAMEIAGHNVKLGRGGIREIEFFVQTQQLIAGGREPDLRSSRTLDTLAELEKAGWISANVRDEMSESYRFLRDVEHRLQMVADQQTHTLPEDRKERKLIAVMSGFGDVRQFDNAVLAHLQRVQDHYRSLFEPAGALGSEDSTLSFTGVEPDGGTLASLAHMGFGNPQSVFSTVRGWHFGRYRALQSEEARQRLTELTPRLLQALASGGRGDTALGAFDTFLEKLPAGYQLFHLLHSNPNLLDLLARILTVAPRLADIITRRPHIFDGMLEPGFFDTDPTSDDLEAALARSLDLARDYEDVLDRARIFDAEQKFAIGARVLAGAVDPVASGRLYSQLAEIVVDAVLARIEDELAERHGCIPGSSCAIVAMGNLGSRELTASSDLDVLLLYDAADPDAQSDGERPLPVTQYYARLTQRLIAAMSAPTGQGVLYELDFRLRPSGKAGPIATSVERFLRYQREEAWTWEHMALTRARSVAGPLELRERIDNGIADILREVGSSKKVAKDMLEMRATMDEVRTAAGPWDVKLAPGGLIDLEFLAQYEVLANGASGGTTAECLKAIDQPLHNDNVTLLGALTTFQTAQQLIRLSLSEEFDEAAAPAGLVDLLLASLAMPDVATATARLEELQEKVRTAFLDRLTFT